MKRGEAKKWRRRRRAKAMAKYARVHKVVGKLILCGPKTINATHTILMASGLPSPDLIDIYLRHFVPAKR